MGDENPIRTLRYYSKPSHEGYRNTIELTVGNNVYCIDDSKQSYVNYNSSRANEMEGNSMAPKSIATISHDKREELRKKGFKSLSMLFSLKYLSLSSIKELNKNSSAPKRVYFVNSIVIFSKDIDTEEDVSSTNACRRNLGKMMRRNKEVKDEDEIETTVKVKEKPSNPNKISKFAGRVRNLNFFIRSFAYECEFMILEDTTNIIDRCLGEMVFGRTLIAETCLVYNKEKGMVMFIEDNEKIKFKMLHTMEIFKQTRLMGASIDSTPRSPAKKTLAMKGHTIIKTYSLRMSTGKTKEI
uniref:Protein kinase-like domain, concanavalin A-like lectin/glucanase domain protein n=1 Tax=Tanacetum cinerariifolium TaxID=118510 RepID=A0A6L2KF71_TANCI|nr:protein kinase-like domain, concanavalin A-like lectin/glucanase domain protein [Tanacetum cinerariifolium]